VTFLWKNHEQNLIFLLFCHAVTQTPYDSCTLVNTVIKEQSFHHIISYTILNVHLFSQSNDFSISNFRSLINLTHLKDHTFSNTILTGRYHLFRLSSQKCVCISHLHIFRLSHPTWSQHLNGVCRKARIIKHLLPDAGYFLRWPCTAHRPYNLQVSPDFMI
jgi:hypothetical protein